MNVLKKIAAVGISASIMAAGLVTIPEVSPLTVVASAETVQYTNYLSYPVPTRTIYYRPGNLMTGDDVKWLQAALNTALGTELPVTGVADEKTGDMIGLFQLHAGISQDECAGPITREALLDEVGRTHTISCGYNLEYVVDVKGNESANCTRIQVYPKNNTAAQNFTFVYEKDGYYSIRQTSTGKVLDVANGATTATIVWLYEVNATDAQLWKFEPGDTAGTYYLHSKLGLYLTVNAINGSLDNTALCVYPKESRLQAAQTWTINPTGSSSSKENFVLSIDWNTINKTGHQSVSGPCGCFAAAYVNDIKDDTTHGWKEYSTGYVPSWGRYSYCISWRKAGITSHSSTSESKVWKDIYNQINKGNPVVVNVTAGRSSGCHYITIVGYKNVTDISKISGSNFLIIDPAPQGSSTAPESFSNIGYKLLIDNGKFHYYY